MELNFNVKNSKLLKDGAKICNFIAQLCDVRAKKSYGQHFLKDEALSRDIAMAIRSHNTYDVLLEVGPGRGALTQYLTEAKKPFYAVEADGDMVNYLIEKEILKEEQILFKNFLKIDFKDHFASKKIGLVGNFPYNISSQIVFKMLDNTEQIPVMVGMFQKEMAQRILSPPGSKDYSVISVFAQLFYSGRLLFDVPPASFSPPPKVNSAVIILERNQRNALPCNYSTFKTVVKLCFGQRRKMLRNTLKGMVADKLFFDDPFFKRRPEHVSIEEFITLTCKIEAISNSLDH